LAENLALEAFVLECERQKIVTTQILKNIKDKKFKFINISINKGLQVALAQFMKSGLQDGHVINSVVFA
jgi:hypothetical protein